MKAQKMIQLHDIIKSTRQLIIVVAVSLVVSCTQLTPQEKEIKETINKTLNLEMFDTVLKGNRQIAYEIFRQQYRYVSVVYLKYGCHYCYSDFVEWHNKMDSLKTPKDYTVLFVIKGKSYQEFMNKVLEVDSVDNHYYVIMDSASQFLRNNNDIPFRVLYRSVLIDNENKIKLIGTPYRSTKMTKLFYKVCGFTPNE